MPAQLLLTCLSLCRGSHTWLGGLDSLSCVAWLCTACPCRPISQLAFPFLSCFHTSPLIQPHLISAGLYHSTSSLLSHCALHMSPLIPSPHFSWPLLPCLTSHITSWSLTSSRLVYTTPPHLSSPIVHFIRHLSYPPLISAGLSCPAYFTRHLLEPHLISTSLYHSTSSLLSHCALHTSPLIPSPHLSWPLLPCLLHTSPPGASPHLDWSIPLHLISPLPLCTSYVTSHTLPSSHLASPALLTSHVTSWSLTSSRLVSPSPSCLTCHLSQPPHHLASHVTSHSLPTILPHMSPLTASPPSCLTCHLSQPPHRLAPHASPHLSWPLLSPILLHMSCVTVSPLLSSPSCLTCHLSCPHFISTGLSSTILLHMSPLTVSPLTASPPPLPPSCLALTSSWLGSTAPIFLTSSNLSCPHFIMAGLSRSSLAPPVP